MSFLVSCEVELAIAEMACVSRNIRRTLHVPSGVPVQRSISERDCSHPYLIYNVSPFKVNVVSSVIVSPVKTKTSFPSFVSSIMRYSPSFFTTSTLYFKFFSSSVVGITSASVTPDNSTAFEKSLFLTI